jgi:hypothetical protein
VLHGQDHWQKFVRDSKVSGGGRLEVTSPGMGWKFDGVANEKEMPPQISGFDCGLFTCTAAEHLVQGLPLTGHGGFSNADAAQNRERVLLEIAKDADWKGLR